MELPKTIPQEDIRLILTDGEPTSIEIIGESAKAVQALADSGKPRLALSVQYKCGVDDPNVKIRILDR